MSIDQRPIHLTTNGFSILHQYYNTIHQEKYLLHHQVHLHQKLEIIYRFLYQHQIMFEIYSCILQICFFTPF